MSVLNVFLSWSGKRSKQMALALRDGLSELLPDVKVWFSPHDIVAGKRWGKELAQALEKADIGILCLTPENSVSEWVLFEAGALSKGTARLVPYLLNMYPEDLPSPLKEFQCVVAIDRQQTLDLVRSLNVLRSKPNSEDELKGSFEKWWAVLEPILQDVGKLVPERQLTSRGFFQQHFPAGLQTEIDKAKEEVWLVGASLPEFSYRKKALQQKLMGGTDELAELKRLRVLLSHPTVLQFAAARKPEDPEIGTGRKKIEVKGTLSSLKDLPAQALERVEIGVTRFPLAYGACAINPRSSDGALYIKLYPYRPTQREKPKFVLRASFDAYWYSRFKQELEALWSGAETLKEPDIARMLTTVKDSSKRATHDARKIPPP